VAGPVDLIRIDYRAGNSPDNIPGNGPANPTEQGINFADLIFDAQADLSLTKVASNFAPDVGSTVTYTLTLTNGGPAAATGITVADVLPVGLSYVAGSIAGGNARSAVPPALSWNVTTLASAQANPSTPPSTSDAPRASRQRARVTVTQPDRLDVGWHRQRRGRHRVGRSHATARGGSAAAATRTAYRRVDDRSRRQHGRLEQPAQRSRQRRVRRHRGGRSRSRCSRPAATWREFTFTWDGVTYAYAGRAPATTTSTSSSTTPTPTTMG
jgi:uncharacterized repeat protein (TIGR01451 family)